MSFWVIPLHKKGYKLYHLVTRKYLVSKDVVFDVTVFYYKLDHHDSLRDLDYLKLLDQTCLLEEEPPTPVLSTVHIIPSLPEEMVVTSTPSVRDNLEYESADHDQTFFDHPEVMDHHQSPPPEPPLKYYNRKSKRGPEESIGGEVMGEWSIALRKGKRLCVKP